jgi:hypothetical protein
LARVAKELIDVKVDLASRVIEVVNHVEKYISL